MYIYICICIYIHKTPGAIATADPYCFAWALWRDSQPAPATWQGSRPLPRTAPVISTCVFHSRAWCDEKLTPSTNRSFVGPIRPWPSFLLYTLESVDLLYELPLSYRHHQIETANAFVIYICVFRSWAQCDEGVDFVHEPLIREITRVYFICGPYTYVSYTYVP